MLLCDKVGTSMLWQCRVEEAASFAGSQQVPVHLSVKGEPWRQSGRDWHCEISARQGSRCAINKFCSVFIDWRYVLQASNDPYCQLTRLSVCLSTTLMLNISVTKRFRGLCPRGKCLRKHVDWCHYWWRQQWYLTIWRHNSDDTIATSRSSKLPHSETIRVDPLCTHYRRTLWWRKISSFS